MNDKCGGNQIRTYIMSVGYCYELYPDQAPRSFKWEAVELRSIAFSWARSRDTTPRWWPTHPRGSCCLCWQRRWPCFPTSDALGQSVRSKVSQPMAAGGPDAPPARALAPSRRLKEVRKGGVSELAAPHGLVSLLVPPRKILDDSSELMGNGKLCVCGGVDSIAKR